MTTPDPALMARKARMSDFRLFCWGVLFGMVASAVSRQFALLTDAAMADLFGAKVDMMLTFGCLFVLVRSLVVNKEPPMSDDLLKLAEPYNPEQSVGSIVYASSDGETAGDVGLLLRMTETDFIWCGEISRKEAEAAGIDDAGWHIVLHQGSDRRVIGQVPDNYDGAEFVEAIAAALRARSAA